MLFILFMQLAFAQAPRMLELNCQDLPSRPYTQIEVRFDGQDYALSMIGLDYSGSRRSPITWDHQRYVARFPNQEEWRFIQRPLGAMLIELNGQVAECEPLPLPPTADVDRIWKAVRDLSCGGLF